MSIRKSLLYFEKRFKKCQENPELFIDLMKDSGCIDKEGNITDLIGAVMFLNKDRIKKLTNISMRGKANNE